MFLIEMMDGLVEKIPAFNMQRMPGSRYLNQLGIRKTSDKMA